LKIREVIMSSQIPDVQLDELALRLSDGTTINLSEIKEISSPEVFLGPPSHPIIMKITSLLEQGYGVVYVLYVTSLGSASKVIPTVDRSSASALAKKLNEAVSAAKKKNVISERVVVGECVKCQRQLRVKAHAVRSQMTLTCKCGYENKLKTD
jgi:hypothetical protein